MGCCRVCGGARAWLSGAAVHSYLALSVSWRACVHVCLPDNLRWCRQADAPSLGCIVAGIAQPFLCQGWPPHIYVLIFICLGSPSLRLVTFLCLRDRC